MEYTNVSSYEENKLNGTIFSSKDSTSGQERKNKKNTLPSYLAK